MNCVIHRHRFNRMGVYEQGNSATVNVDTAVRRDKACRVGVPSMRDVQADIEEMVETSSTARG